MFQKIDENTFKTVAITARVCAGVFVSLVHQAQAHLLQLPSGTFVLRFSESVCGGITGAWVGVDELQMRCVSDSENECVLCVKQKQANN